MPKTGQDFIHFKGNDRIISFVIEDVEDLLGFKAEWAFSVDETSAPIVTKSSEGVGPLIELDGNEVFVTLVYADTATIGAAKYYHELKLWDVDDKVSTPAIGTMDLRPVILP